LNAANRYAAKKSPERASRLEKDRNSQSIKSNFELPEKF
jgi:hypothetical protein